MSAVALDPLALVLAPSEGRYEWSEGSLIEMAPPTEEHGRGMLFLAALMRAYSEVRSGGQVMPDGYTQRLEAGTVRVPDVAYFRGESLHKLRPTFSEGAADLIVEIVSPDSRVRDRRDKFFDYAKAGVEEYWIVDPMRQRAEFYLLRDGVYEVVEQDAEGRIHSSALPGFFVRVEWLWNPPTQVEAMRELGLV